jgi:hypothetical protein
MIKQQGFRAKFKSRQQGAVAIIVAICLVVLIGMLGLVLDLGHLYVAKTELQNAADASALSGAKELDGTMEGLSKAKLAACEVGGMNKFDLSSKQVANTNDYTPCTNLTLWVGTCPEDSCMKLIGNISSDDVAGRLFMKVDTGTRTLDTWFARIWNIAQMKTFGMAVAGPNVLQVAPIGICAVDHNTPGDGIYSYYGYDRGVAYNLVEINQKMLGLADGSPLWLHPTALTQAQCNADSQFSANSKFRPYLCLGKSSAGVSQYVYANTGWEGNQDGALNTRFRASGDNKDSDYANMSAENCAPDKNVKMFCEPSNCSTFTNAGDCNSNSSCEWNGPAKICTPKCNGNVDWLNYTPTQQGANLPPPSGGVIADTRGESVIATYNKPQPPAAELNTSYPATSPYQAGIDGTTKYYGAPYTGTDITPTKGRRLITVVIVDCSTGAKLSGNCAELPKLGLAQFFMPVKANSTSSGINPKSFYLEFVRKIPTTEESEIKLYK